MLGLGPEQPGFTPDYDQFADFHWSKDDLALAFDNPIGLMTQALVADLNQAAGSREYGVKEPQSDTLPLPLCREMTFGYR